MRPFRPAAARRWPAILASTFILLLTCYAGRVIVRTPPLYAESATVLFSAPPQQSSAALYSQEAVSLISTGTAIQQVLMSQRIRKRVLAGGGTGSYDFELVNLYNQDYPDFAYPEATLSASSPRPGSTERTYRLAKRALIGILAQAQRQSGAHRRDRIVADIADDSGVVEQSGSPKRALAGLLLLAAVVERTVAGALGRLTAHKAGAPHGFPDHGAGEHAQPAGVSG